MDARLDYSEIPEKGTPEFDEWDKVRRAKNMESCGIRKKFYNASFENLIDDDEFFKKRSFTKNHIDSYRKNKDYIFNIANNFEHHRDVGSNFIFSGNPGTGKDYFATCLMKHVANEHKMSVLMVKLDDMILEMRESLAPGKSERKTVEKFTEPDFLVINEVGVQKDSEFTWNRFYKVIDDRYGDCKPTLLISNLKANELDKILDERVVSRFQEGESKIFIFNWPDLRLGI